MNKDKMQLISKIFNNETIRTVWDKESEKCYISVVDVVGVISENDNPRNYWKVLKHRLKQEENESVTNCNQLKLKFPNIKGFSVRNLKNTKKYHIECSKSEKVQISSAQIPWSHNMLILDKIEDNIQRICYIN